MKTAALLVGITCMVVARLAGCERTSEPDFTAGLDWESWVHRQAGEEYGTIYSGVLTAGMGHSQSDTRIIEGEKYFGMQVEAGQDKQKTLEFYARPGKSEKPSVRIYLRTNGVVKVGFRGLEGGVLQDVNTHRQHMPPFLLQPGEYHLEAMDSTASTASRPAGDPSPAPASKQTVEQQ